MGRREFDMAKLSYREAVAAAIAQEKRRDDKVVFIGEDIAAAGVEILTLGQYLQPTRDHLPVDRWVHPDEFAQLRSFALGLGFGHCESGPLVRSSYHAHEHVG